MEDAELLEAWRSGDGQAGSELFERHFASLERFFCTKIAEGAEDLMQATFLACVEARERVQPGGFRAYLFGVARKQLVTHFRRKRRQQGRDANVSLTSMSDGGMSPSLMVAQRGEFILLLRALRALPLDHQITLELFYWEHFSTQQLAAVMEVPQGTAKRRLQRARALLRQELEALEESAELIESTLDNMERWAEALRKAVDGKAPQTK